MEKEWKEEKEDERRKQGEERRKGYGRRGNEDGYEANENMAESIIKSSNK
jgi:hypothetical protein